MRRTLILALLLALALPVLAQGVRNAITPTVLANKILAHYSAANCAATACTATGQLCVQGTTLYLCSVGSGFFAIATASPAGSNTQLQFNDGGVLAGDAGLTYNKTTDSLTVSGGVGVTTGNITINNGTLDCFGCVTDQAVGSITSRSKIPSALAYEDEKNVFSTAAAGGTAHGQRIEVIGNGVLTPLVLQINPTTAAIGDGVSLNLEVENSIGTRIVGAQVWGVTTDVTSGTEDAYLAFNTTAAGAGGERMRLDQTGLILPASATVDGKDLDLVPANARIVHVCPTGCEYATPQLACAGETPSSSNPIVFLIWPGTYTTQVTSCSNKTNFTLLGFGPGVSTISVSGIVGADGPVRINGATDWSVRGLTIKGHRSLYAKDYAGRVVITGNEFKSDNTQSDEDCLFMESPEVGAQLVTDDNLCWQTVDGLTINDDCANLVWSAKGNTFRADPGATASAAMSSFNLACAPEAATIQGNDIWVERTSAAGTSTSGLRGFNFHTDCVDGTCNGHAAGNIRLVGNRVHVREKGAKSAGFFGNAIGATVAANAAGFGTIWDIGNDWDVRNDCCTAAADTGQALGWNHENGGGADPTTVNIIGSHIRTVRDGNPAGGSYGAFRATPSYANAFKVAATVWDLSNDTQPVALDQRLISASGGATNSVEGGTPWTWTALNSGRVGLKLDNINTGNARESPLLQLCNEEVAGDNCFNLQVDPTGNLEIENDAGTLKWELSQNGGLILGDGAVANLELYLNSGNGIVKIGSNAAQTAAGIRFDGAGADPTLLWNDNGTPDLLSFGSSSGTLDYVLRLATDFATAPATCSIGDIYVDTSGALCFCKATNTWEDLTDAVVGVGGCV